MTEHGSIFQMQLLPVVEAHIKLLQEFEKYFAAEQNATLEAYAVLLMIILLLKPNI